MANTFFPVVSTFVKADTGYNTNGNDYHPQNTEYKVSIGYEVVDGNGDNLVFKVQMCYNGKISGRRSPSFPVSSSDWNNVQKAMEKVKDFYNKQANPALRNCII